MRWQGFVQGKHLSFFVYHSGSSIGRNLNVKQKKKEKKKHTLCK